MSIMSAARIAYLQALLDAEYISTHELHEIENAFAQLDPATLSDLPENAMAGDMLDELYAYGVTMGSVLRLTPGEVRQFERALTDSESLS